MHGRAHGSTLVCAGASEYERAASPLKEEEKKLTAMSERLEKLEEKVEEQEDLVDKLKASLGPTLRLLRSTFEGVGPRAAANKDEV